ncbi:formylmethanofuran--tetrahydromethanopterin N-formyltransferase [Candidatus Bathyarchaeota archaeon]|nr:formylmethanofuran--tetrahydromethanopterin N-formyltransferase [Candidatus Bathyarchaeota archaeon]
MILNGVEVEETFAELWELKIARLLVTAISRDLALRAAYQATGFAFSIAICPVQSGIERFSPSEVNPDGRPGVIMQFSVPSGSKYGVERLKEQLIARALTLSMVPTASLFDFMPFEAITETLPVGEAIRKHGEGYEKELMIGKHRVICIPVTSGKFNVERTVGVTTGLDGLFVIMAENQAIAVSAANAAWDAMKLIEGVCPYGLGMDNAIKKGSNRYTDIIASTHDLFCPTIQNIVPGSKVPIGVQSIVTVVFMGLNASEIRRATHEGIVAATKIEGVKRISAYNFGGKMGSHKLHLSDILKME